MLSMTDRVKPNPQVVDTELSDTELALLHLETKTYFSLNATGARVWAGVKAGRTLGEIARSLQAEFEVSAERAEKSVAELVADLQQRELVTIAPGDA